MSSDDPEGTSRRGPATPPSGWVNDWPPFFVMYRPFWPPTYQASSFAGSRAMLATQASPMGWITEPQLKPPSECGGRVTTGMLNGQVAPRAGRARAITSNARSTDIDILLNCWSSAPSCANVTGGYFFFSSFRTSFATAFNVSDTPLPLMATASNVGSPLKLSWRYISSAGKAGGGTGFLYLRTPGGGFGSYPCSFRFFFRVTSDSLFASMRAFLESATKKTPPKPF